ncbi:thiamine-binding protein [Stomatohabitans albus]|uniref:thiamine-binding protein n=1 Tax=Stomatohabitans albus TaxID=3110766 RepID=UPI00300D7919
MLVAFSIAPMTTQADGSVTDTVARMVQYIRASGLPNETNAMFTNIEGEWDEVMAVVKGCCEIAAQSSPRLSLVLKADIRPGHTNMITGKVQRVEDALRNEM